MFFFTKKNQKTFIHVKSVVAMTRFELAEQLPT
jgi:hypothetical protein